MRSNLAVTLTLPVVLALGAARPGLAQFGISGGMNLSKFVGGTAEDESRNKLRLGARMGLINISSLSIGPEFYYAQRGGQQTAPASEPNPLVEAYNFSMNYLEVPVIAKLSLMKIGPLRPYIAGGPVYAWQLKCDVTLLTAARTASGEEQDCQDDTFKNARTAYKNADKGIMFGGGVDMRVLGLGAVSLDARLLRGLNRLTEDSADGDVKTQSFSLMLGYSVGVGR
jgi:hypothetical protein